MLGADQPLQISTLKERKNQIPAVGYLVGETGGNNVFRGMNLMSTESSVTVDE